MSEKYIHENKNSFAVIKNSRSYGKFNTLEDAIFACEILMDNDWDLSCIDEVYLHDGSYIVVKVIDEKLNFLARYKKPPSQEQIQNLVKKYKRNPNNSRYGLNITRFFETFFIKKQIAGEKYIFGYYDNLEDAEFVRNHLLDHMWDINSFSQVMYDEETESYKIIEIIDDKIYVIDSYQSESEIDIQKSHEKFLAKISKHKFGLASHPYLDDLKDHIPELEESFNVKTHDEMWNFEDISDPLTDIVFNLTPWQKLVYDAVDASTVEDIEKTLKRYQSKNFREKIQKNLDELIELKLISKNGDVYVKV